MVTHNDINEFFSITLTSAIGKGKDIKYPTPPSIQLFSAKKRNIINFIIKYVRTILSKARTKELVIG